MKKSAIFVRTGFPPNHELLLQMIKDGDLYGYAFDEDESTFNERHGNVWASPPNAWLTEESTTRNAEQWVDAIVQATEGDCPNTVN
jgi:lactate dehydrogenase-like 2-hydroxyacid dehydrogenase